MTWGIFYIPPSKWRYSHNFLPYFRFKRTIKMIIYSKSGERHKDLRFYIISTDPKDKEK